LRGEIHRRKKGKNWDPEEGWQETRYIPQRGKGEERLRDRKGKKSNSVFRADPSPQGSQVLKEGTKRGIYKSLEKTTKS